MSWFKKLLGTPAAEPLVVIETPIAIEEKPGIDLKLGKQTVRVDREFRFKRDGSPDDEWEWYEVNPDAVYPVALDYLRGILSGAIKAPEYLIIHTSKAKTLPAISWELARVPYSQIKEGILSRESELDRVWEAAKSGGIAPYCSMVNSHQVGLHARSEALECARLVFTGELREQAGKAVGVHILKGSGEWRL
jgi:hypothetical protein